MRFEAQKMPVSQNFNAFLGAAVLGVLSAAGMYIFEHYRQERNRHAMAKDLARLDQELSQVKREIKELASKRDKVHKTRTKQKYTINKPNSIVSTSTADDYLSASNFDSSDLEYYDVSDDEAETLTDNASATNLENVLKDIDMILNTDSMNQLESVLLSLEDLCVEYPENPELLWRIGKVLHKICDDVEDKNVRRTFITKGIDACSLALQLKSDHPEIHKWYAILIGDRSDIVSLQEKINDGHLFKKHVDTALALNPNDASLHHMLGRFDYEVASLKWYERKVATALFGEPPNSTYHEALKHFIEAEKLANFEWKENKMMIAKCKIAMEDYTDAVDWLTKASNCKHGDSVDDKVDSEVKALLEKYSNYR